MCTHSCPQAHASPTFNYSLFTHELTSPLINSAWNIHKQTPKKSPLNELTALSGINSFRWQPLGMLSPAAWRRWVSSQPQGRAGLSAEETLNINSCFPTALLQRSRRICALQQSNNLQQNWKFNHTDTSFRCGILESKGPPDAVKKNWILSQSSVTGRCQEVTVELGQVASSEKAS